MNFIFLLNGFLDKEYDSQFFKKYNCIVCVDGGYEHFLKLKIGKDPDYIIGDFDSITNMEERCKNIPGRLTCLFMQLLSARNLNFYFSSL